MGITETENTPGKPLLGLRSRYIIEIQRVKEICDAVLSYKAASKSVPIEWIRELEELVTK
jgi:hypothetical protein